MFWADRVAQQLKKRELSLEWVDDMKTPSGRIHVGSLRGVVIHDLIYKALLKTGVNVKYTYVFDDHDPMDKLPSYLDPKKWGKHLGKPLFMVPAPEKGFVSYAQYFALEFKDIFNSIGSFPEVIWASELYETGKMNVVVKECLDNVETIRQIYFELYGRKVSDRWYPFTPVCSNCGKMATAKVTDWDGEFVAYTCGKDIVSFTEGCGFSEKKTPFSDGGIFNGKLLWKVEWAAKWKVIGVTVEGAGKDHMVKGGSHDVARLVCDRVLHYEVPYDFMYEFFLVSGKKMSSSKGLGSSAKEVSAVLPPEILRFLMVRTKNKHPIDFDPGGMTIPDLFDEYDRCAAAYFERENDYLARIYELSQVDGVLDEKLFHPRFRDVACYIQMPDVDLIERFAELKGGQLTTIEKKELKKRVKYAKIWLGGYAPEDFVFQYQEKLPKAVKNLSKSQKDFLKNVAQYLIGERSGDELQAMLYDAAKKAKCSVGEAFVAFYIVLLGKSSGPRAGYLIFDIGVDKVRKRLLEVTAG